MRAGMPPATARSAFGCATVRSHTRIQPGQWARMGLAQDPFERRFHSATPESPFVSKITTGPRLRFLKFFFNHAVDFGGVPAQMPELTEGSHPPPATAVARPELFGEGL